MYPGRGSSTPTLDLFITLLSMGREGWNGLLNTRADVFGYLKERLAVLAQERGERILETPANLISLALTLTPTHYSVIKGVCPVEIDRKPV